MKRKVCFMVVILALAFSLAACEGENMAEPGSDEGMNSQFSVGDKASDYASCYQQLEHITWQMQGLVHGMAEQNEALFTVLLYPLSDEELVFTAGLQEKDFQSSQREILKRIELLGNINPKVTRNAAHDYTISFTNNDGEVQQHCLFDPQVGSLRMNAITNGQASGLYEFIPLGQDQYAFQTDKERAVVTYADGAIKGFRYTMQDEDIPGYTAEHDGIYPQADGLDEAWVQEKGPFEQTMTFDGSTLHIEAMPLLGELVVVDLTP